MVSMTDFDPVDIGSIPIFSAIGEYVRLTLGVFDFLSFDIRLLFILSEYTAVEMPDKCHRNSNKNETMIVRYCREQ